MNETHETARWPKRTTWAALLTLLSAAAFFGGVSVSSADDTGPSAPPQSTQDDFTRGYGAIHRDLAFEKVFIPPKGIPAYVIGMKAKANDVKPAVILLHGGEAGDADKKQTMAWNWPIELPRMGYLVVCTDGWGCGEHPGVADFKEIKKTTSSLWGTLVPRIDETANDCMDVYDYLAARPDVDAERIGLMGISGGGAVTLAAASRDNKFAAFVAMNTPANYLSPRWHESMFYLLKGIRDVKKISEADREQIRKIDPMAHLEKIPPKPLLIIHGNHDRMVVPAVTEPLYEQLRPLYAATPDRLARKEFDAYPLPAGRDAQINELMMTHNVIPGMTQSAYDWLDKYLKPRQAAP